MRFLMHIFLLLQKELKIVVATLILLILPSIAPASDLMMECNGRLYKYSDNFLHADEIELRADGTWLDWCPGSHELEIIDHSARCISAGTEMKDFPEFFDLAEMEEHIKGYVISSCNCGSVTVDVGQDYLNCIDRLGIRKNEDTLNRVTVEYHDLVDPDVLAFAVCPKVKDGSLIVSEALLADYPTYLGESFLNSNANLAKLHSRETKKIAVIDFLDPKLYTEWKATTQPFQKLTSGFNDCVRVQH